MYVNKSVTLEGIGHPVVDANGSGSAITLNANGIGNTPYSINPEKDECDDYPLMQPFENYISSESETEVAATSNTETIAKTFVTLLNESERT